MTRASKIFATLACAGAWAGFAAAQEHHHHQPPQQAFDACKSKSAGDACTVTFHDKAIDGTCKLSRDSADDALACHPDHMGPPPEAVDACKSKSAGDACTVTFGDKTISGTCGTRHDGGELACHGQHHHPAP